MRRNIRGVLYQMRSGNDDETREAQQIKIIKTRRVIQICHCKALYKVWVHYRQAVTPKPMSFELCDRRFTPIQEYADSRPKNQRV